MSTHLLLKQIFLRELFHPSAPLVKGDFDLFSHNSMQFNKFCHLWVILFDFGAFKKKKMISQQTGHFSL